jgi:hypothetical protein
VYRKMAKGRCQCDPECKNPALYGSAFCKVHDKNCTRISPLSGSELQYNPDEFNKYQGIKDSNNCYAYALGYKELPKKCTKDSCNESFPQPGRASGYPSWQKVKGKQCLDITARTMGDIPGIQPAEFTDRCPIGTRKIALVTDPENDYHWYRQDSNGWWSHKPGATDVTNKDTLERPIYDPQLAARKSKDSRLDYKNFCGYLCLPLPNKVKRRKVRYTYRISRRGGLRKTRGKRRH